MVLDLRMDRQITADRLAGAIRSAILRGELAQGEPLRETAIAKSAGVARNTVREALRLLTNEGLVTHHAFRGVAVTQLEESDVVDIFRARRALELAGVEALDDLDDAAVAGLQAAVAGFEQAVDAEDWAAAFEQDMGLHARLVGAVGSRRLDESFHGLMRELRLVHILFDGLETESLPIDREQHRRIVELARARDRSGCRELVLAHLDRAEALILGLMRTHADGVREPATP